MTTAVDLPARDTGDRRTRVRANVENGHPPLFGYSLASALIGPNPTGSVSAITLCLKQQLELHVPGWQQQNMPIIVACSGGADSLALAVAAIDLCSRAGRICYPIVVDHGLRKESVREAEGVVNLLRLLGGRATVIRGDGAIYQAASGGIEAAARELRYCALRRAAEQLRQESSVAAPLRNPTTAISHPPLILLGHTADDQAETVLLALARGSGTRSIRAMLPLRNESDCCWFRPLLEIRRSQTEAFCQQLHLPVVQDPTNAVDGPWRRQDGHPLVRVALRHQAIPALERALGDDPVPALVRTAELAAADDAALQHWAETAYSDSVMRVHISGSEQTSPDTIRLNVAALSDFPLAVRSRIYRLAAAELDNHELTLSHYRAIDALVSAWKGQGPIAASGLQIKRVGQKREAMLLFSETGI